MIGQGARALTGSQDQAIRPNGPVDGRWVGGYVTLPWAATDGARGIPSTTDGIISDQSHAGLLEVGPFNPGLLLRQVPVILVSYQLPPNTQSRQNRRLPLNMVNPRLAWSPS